MPTYDYLCEANGRVVEVKHRMSEGLSTWGELCRQAGIDAGETRANVPVRRLATGGQVVKSSSLGESVPSCAAGPCCGGGTCGIDG
jgi:predicted nucleic acid-binding Zn ribbon protein